MGFSSSTPSDPNAAKRGGFSRRPQLDAEAYRMREEPGALKAGVSQPLPAAASQPGTGGPAAAAGGAQGTAGQRHDERGTERQSVVRAFGKRPTRPAETVRNGPPSPGDPILPATLNACIERMAIENAWPPEKVRAAKVRAMRDPATAEKAYREAFAAADKASEGTPAPEAVAPRPTAATGNGHAASLRDAIEQHPGKVVFAVSRTVEGAPKVAFSVEEPGACNVLHGLLFESVPATSDAFGRDSFDKPMPGLQRAASNEPAAEPEGEAEQAKPARSSRGRGP